MANCAITNTRRVESKVLPGVSFILRKMTEGRRSEWRNLMREPNKKWRELLRDQAALETVAEEKRDYLTWMDIQDEVDAIVGEQINPGWITWGVKQLDGLECDGKPLGLEDWKDWPSALVNEVVDAVKAEAELNGVERKNFESSTTSGERTASILQPITAVPAKSEVSGEQETATSILQDA